MEPKDLTSDVLLTNEGITIPHTGETIPNNQASLNEAIRYMKYDFDSPFAIFHKLVQLRVFPQNPTALLELPLEKLLYATPFYGTRFHTRITPIIERKINSMPPYELSKFVAKAHHAAYDMMGPRAFRDQIFDLNISEEHRAARMNRLTQNLCSGGPITETEVRLKRLGLQHYNPNLGTEVPMQALGDNTSLKELFHIGDEYTNKLASYVNRPLMVDALSRAAANTLSTEPRDKAVESIRRLYITTNIKVAGDTEYPHHRIPVYVYWGGGATNVHRTIYETITVLFDDLEIISRYPECLKQDTLKFVFTTQGKLKREDIDGPAIVFTNDPVVYHDPSNGIIATRRINDGVITDTINILRGRIA